MNESLALALRIGSVTWARTGIVMGVVLMGISFALFRAIR
jgi:hypothetical protein